MILESKIYKGIEYVELSDLPQVQQESFLRTTNRHIFIKILIDGKIVSNCIHYQDYCQWFNSVYKFDPKKQIQQNHVEAAEVPSELVLKAS